MYNQKQMKSSPEQVTATMLLFITTTIVVVVIVQVTVAQSNNKHDFTYTLDEGWPYGKELFGNIAGVDVDRNDNIIIFHRGSRRWNTTTFNAEDVYLWNRDSPIPEETVVFIDPTEKRVTRAWGRDTFFMPHGLSLDLEGKNLWLTDVALHQVFKYSLDGTRALIELGTPFTPGHDESHFCKPTSVADTGEFVFVADGYCNSRIAMFSADGKYLSEFGQSSDAVFLPKAATVQPTFNIPHKITYAKEAKMLCVADRENGRIQCFSFDPKQPRLNQGDETGLILNGAIKPKFTLADPQFNGRLFSLDYSPYRGGIIVAVSGEDPYDNRKPPLGFVYNVTTGQMISKFQPNKRRTFGMAHDLVLTGEEADALYVVDIAPVNLWRFSRPVSRNHISRAAEFGKVAGESISHALSAMNTGSKGLGMVGYIVIFSIIGTLLLVATKTRKIARYSNSNNSFAQLYSNNYPTSINSLFGRSNGFQRRTTGRGGPGMMLSTMFSRRPFFSLFKVERQQQNEFSRIPLEESDNSDNDKSDSDVEEFNINQANPSVKINV